MSSSEGWPSLFVAEPGVGVVGVESLAPHDDAVYTEATSRRHHRHTTSPVQPAAAAHEPANTYATPYTPLVTLTPPPVYPQSAIGPSFGAVPGSTARIFHSNSWNEIASSSTTRSIWGPPGGSQGNEPLQRPGSAADATRPRVSETLSVPSHISSLFNTGTEFVSSLSGAVSPPQQPGPPLLAPAPVVPAPLVAGLTDAMPRSVPLPTAYFPPVDEGCGGEGGQGRNAFFRPVFSPVEENPLMGGQQHASDFYASDAVPETDTSLRPGSAEGPAAFGEHPFGEHPSRTLFVRNINSNVEDEELRNLFEQYGDIRSMYTPCKNRGFVMISYHDIRHAKNAMRHLQGKVIRRRQIDIHYSIPKENPSERDRNQGTLVVFNLDPSTSNEMLREVFEAYGEVKEIRETPNKKHHKFIEFYDVRDAERAMKSLNKTEVNGKKIKIEPSRPGGPPQKTLANKIESMEEPFADQALMDSQQFSQAHIQPSFLRSSQQSMFMAPKPPPGGEGSYPTSYTEEMYAPPPLYVRPAYPGQQLSAGARGPSVLQPPRRNNVGSPTQSLYSHVTAVTGDATGVRPVRSPVSLDSIQQWNQPSMRQKGGGDDNSHLGGSRSRSGSRTRSSSEGSDGSQNQQPTEIRSSRRIRSGSEDDRSHYALDIRNVEMGMDQRTTLMIRNIPNKYTQKMLLATVDERHRGEYDFFYLPIDFRNKCNVGYAFINMINAYPSVVTLCNDFNGAKWDKFNSEKVCEITYARIQGKQNLIQHFQNSSLMCEDKKCRPILFKSDGPNQGEQEPFPIGPNVRSRRRSDSGHTRDNERERRRSDAERGGYG